MFLKTLTLTNFRNYKKADFDFSPTTTIIVGPNAVGKTNILEAIYLLASGRSFRAEKENEMIFEGKEVSHVKVIVNGSIKSLEIVLTNGMVLGKKTPRKKRLVNGVSRRYVDFVGNMPAVLFWPEDLDLITGSPALRRSYLNNVLSLTDRTYRHSLSVFEKALLIRNKLLRDKREFVYEKKLNGHFLGNINEQIDYWGKILTENGNIISGKRQSLIDFINKSKIQNASTKASSKSKIQNINYNIFYDKSEISDVRFSQYKEEEVLAGNTLVGPHRDDFIISKTSIKNKTERKELSKFGSRGEQRLGVLHLKMAELCYVEEKLGIKPILLLDDILSELDEKHRQIVLQLIPNQQTVLTTCEYPKIKDKLPNKPSLIKLKD